MSIAKTLRKSAQECREQNIDGWGNAMADGADEIERLERHVEFRDKIIKKHEKDNAELKHDLSVYKSIEEFEDEAERRD